MESSRLQKQSLLRAYPEKDRSFSRTPPQKGTQRGIVIILHASASFLVDGLSERKIVRFPL
jgi:hypothetical protein